jgi:hypothetical protein
VRFGQFAIECLPSGQLLLAAPVVVQRICTDRQPGAVIQRDGQFDTLAIHERTVRGTKIRDDDTIACALELAVAARNSAAFQDQFARRTAPDGHRQEVQCDVARRRIL